MESLSGIKWNGCPGWTGICTIAGQIEFWAKMGELAEEYPDLPLSLIQDILLGKEQVKAGEGTPYVFGEGE